jgi:hypothetical protein
MVANAVGGGAAPLGGLSGGGGGGLGGLGGGSGISSYIGAATQVMAGLSPGGTFSETLGGVGGAVGTAFGGPVGGAIGDTLGTLIGGLFGPKAVNPTDNPDQASAGYDQTAYGKLVSDLNGITGQFGGKTIAPDAQYNPGLGGTTLSADLLSSIASTVAAGPGSTPQLYAEAQRLQALAGTDKATNALGIASEKQGQFTLNSGQQISVADYESLVSQYQTDSGGLNSAVNSYSLQRTYANPNISALKSLGAQTEPIITGSGAATTTTTKAAPTVHVTVQGSVVGATGVAELVQIISKGLATADSGGSTASGSNYQNIVKRSY